MSGSPDGSSVDRRQLLLVAVAVAALVIAAFLAPQANPQREQSQSERPPEPLTPPENAPGDGDGDRLLPVLRDAVNRTGDQLREIQVGDESVRINCLLAVVPNPTPGTEVTVFLYHRSGPIQGATVTFDGQPIGRTDPGGRVSGTVPYERDIDVSVSLPEGISCSFDRKIEGEGGTISVDTDESTAAVSDLEAATNSGPAPQSVFAPYVDRSGERNQRRSLETGVRQRSIDTHTGSDNASVSLSVSGEVTIDVVGTPYPGEEVQIRAEIAEEPMRSAAVSVDGDRVGRTDLTGGYTLSIPDDGRDEISVTVSRGDFEGSKTIDVALLEASVRPAGLLTLPGSRAAVVATQADSRVADAVVRIDGERVGTTDSEGTFPMRAPTDIDATITVSTDRQRATVEMRAVYEATAIALVVYGVVSALVAGVLARRNGRRQGKLVLVGSGGLFALVVVHAYGGRFALAILGLAALVGALAVFAYRNRERIAEDAESAGGLIAAFGGWLTQGALAAAAKLERLLDRAGPALSELLSRIRSRSPRALLAGGLSWLRALPASTIRALPSVSSRAVLIAVLAVAVVVAGGLLAGWLGVLAALGVVAALALVSGKDEATSAETEREESTSDAPTLDDRDAEEQAAETGPTTLRERWRTFARWVRPRRWRKSTTGDVEREASEKGYPDAPVETLAAAFRRLEYSDREVPGDQREDASEAFDRLVDHRKGGDDQ